LFDFDKATIKKNYSKDIDHMVGVMKEHSDLNLTIEGHTDNVGKAAYNKKLSQRRADAVKNYMVKKGGVAQGIERRDIRGNKAVHRGNDFHDRLSPLCGRGGLRAQVRVWKMFFSPLVMNSTAMAVRIRPMIRVMMLIPVLPSFLAM